MPSFDSVATRAILFSGHMIDAPGRPQPRFPPALEGRAAAAIARALDWIGVHETDVGVSSAACGGDILFAEALRNRGIPIRIYLPFDEPTFLKHSVDFANHRWPERYRAVVARATLLIAPEVLGALPKDTDPYERTNEWMLAEARRIAGARVSFIALWNGEGGDGPGGTKHMMDAVRSNGGAVDWIDIRRL